MPHLPLNSLAPAVAELISPERPMSLAAGSPNLALRKRLASISAEELAVTPARIVDCQMAAAFLAGLWLRHDFIDEAHTIVQAIDRPEASYWHAIVHRREGDYSNAKYWNHKAGELPIFAALAEHLRAMTSPVVTVAAQLATNSAGRLYPDGWVDVCRDACRGRSPFDDPAIIEWALAFQQTEWELLMDFCWRRAVGSASLG